LRGVHDLVGSLELRLGGEDVRGGARRADAGADRHQSPGHGHGSSEGATGPSGEARRGDVVAEVGEHDDELIPAQMGGEVVGAEQAVQASGEHDEQLDTGSVADAAP
jgi:hypothetical protein